jgi:hypothetical protein
MMAKSMSHTLGKRTPTEASTKKHHTQDDQVVVKAPVKPSPRHYHYLLNFHHSLRQQAAASYFAPGQRDP